MWLPRFLSSWLSNFGNDLLRHVSERDGALPRPTRWTPTDDLPDDDPFAWTAPRFTAWKFAFLWMGDEYSTQAPLWSDIIATSASYEIGPIGRIDSQTIEALKRSFVGEGTVTIHPSDTDAVLNGLPTGHNVVRLEGVQRVKPHVYVDGRYCALYRVNKPGTDGFVDFHELMAKGRNTPA